MTNPKADPLRVALRQAMMAFESISENLICHLDEPARSVFWKAVESRDAIRAALASQSAAAWPKEDLGEGRVVDVDPESLMAADTALYAVQADSKADPIREEAMRKALQSAWDNSRYGFEIEAMVEAALALPQPATECCKGLAPVSECKCAQPATVDRAAVIDELAVHFENSVHHVWDKCEIAQRLRAFADAGKVGEGK